MTSEAKEPKLIELADFSEWDRIRTGKKRASLFFFDPEEGDELWLVHKGRGVVVAVTDAEEVELDPYNDLNGWLVSFRRVDELDERCSTCKHRSAHLGHAVEGGENMHRCEHPDHNKELPNGVRCSDGVHATLAWMFTGPAFGCVLHEREKREG